MDEKRAKMLKFIMGKGHQPSADRLKVQKDLFGFHRSVRHGFPHKPSALAWDPELKIMAIGTKQGLLRVYGKPGVEFYGQHESENTVSKMLFLPGQGRLVTLTEDNILHLWEINATSITERLTTSMEGRLKQISNLCLDMEAKKVLLGTEGGNIYSLNLNNFKIEDSIIYQDIVIQNSTEEFKVNPGAVEALELLSGSKLLIGYARGLMVVWNRTEAKAEKSFYANQQLEAISITPQENGFMSAHNDGSYIMWSFDSDEPVEPPNTPYGPYPCKAIAKVYWDQAWTVFCGGMPRASYGDKFTVTVMKGEEKHSVFDLTSKIVDFTIIKDDNGPSALVILAEEELVVVDLKAETWPATYGLPYLNPIHASSITCLSFVNDVKKEVYEKIKSDLGSRVTSDPWPISGGSLPKDAEQQLRNVLITGHEDGTVKFWACGSVALSPLATVKSGVYFVSDDLDAPRDEQDEEEEEEWPPFKKVGHFDPYSDDPRLAIKKVDFCGNSGKLVIGGTAGQVVICNLVSDAGEDADVPVIKSDLVTEKEGFAWKGHQPLLARAGPFKMPVGFQPQAIVQISPPASINSVAYSEEYGLVAAGTAHGLVIFDSVQNSVVTAKCTLNAHDIANADDNPMSRRKSLKKSLRESFRRLRKGRSQRNKKKEPVAATTDPIKRELPRSESPEARPVERAIEARSGSEDGLGSMVRCLHFAETFIASPTTTSPTLWAGTNSGQILVFLLTIPKNEGEKRKEDKVTGMLGKEIQLKHRAPVITIQVLDHQGLPLTDESKEVPHKVLIASEEQFKMFLLPTLKPCGKYKLTAHEGARIRKIGFTTFSSKMDKNYSENCLTCLTNQGDLAIHSLPELRRQVLQTQCMRKEDVIGISTLVFTPKGEAVYLSSSSELSRVSMAAAFCMEPKGTLEIDSSARHEINDVKVATLKSALAQPAKKASTEDAEAAAVARQNQLNEQQAQGNKSPVVANGDPHNETTMSEISADITLDSVKDHTMSQQQLLETTMTSTTSKSSISKVASIPEEPKAEASSTDETKPMTNGASTEDVNGVSESLESTVLSDHNDLTTTTTPEPQLIPDHKSNDTTVVEANDEHDEEMQENEHDETVLEKTLEVKENEANEERVTCVDEPAPLASLESDEAPLASLESTATSELSSM